MFGNVFRGTYRDDNTSHLSHLSTCSSHPAGKILQILWGIPGMVVVGGGNPRGNLGYKWNENPHRNSGEIFKPRLKWEGSFPKPVNILTYQKYDIKSSLGYFHITGSWDPAYVMKMHFESLREARGKFPRGNIPRDSTGKGGRNIHIENSPEFPQGN